MSRYRKLTTACLAAALALGLAACGGGGSSTPPATTGDDTKKGTSMAPAPGSCTDAACVKLYADALTAAQNELAALLADPKSTQAQITAARNAVTAAQTALSTAQTALATYNAMQPPTYALKAMDDAVKKQASSQPETMPTEFGNLTDGDLTDDEIGGGEVTVETGSGATAKKVYAKATWPIGMISGWKGSVWEKEGTDTKDSVVVYTNVEDDKSANYSAYYAKGTSEVSGSDPAGYQWVDWVGVASVVNDDTGTLNLVTAQIAKTDVAKRFNTDDFGAGQDKLPADDDQRTYVDEDKNKANIQASFSGMFHGVAGTFKCDGSACTVTNAAGALTFSADWQFVPSSTDVKVAGAQKDVDYIDFGYWVQTDMSDDPDSYKVAAFFRGQAQYSSLVGASETSGDAVGEATYSGGALGSIPSANTPAAATALS